MTTLHDFGGVLGWPLDTFFWAFETFYLLSLTQFLGLWNALEL